MSGQGQSSHAPATLSRADDVRENQKQSMAFFFAAFVWDFLNVLYPSQKQES